MVVSSMRRAGAPQEKEDEEREEKKRVMDYLREKDDEGGEMDTTETKRGLLFLSTPLSSSSSSSPDFSSCRRNLMSRWFCSTRKSTRLPRLRGEHKGKGMEERKEEEVGLPVLEMEKSGEVGSGSHLWFSGQKPETTSFNLGMGLGLVFLLVKTATEFNKMTELRTQMEMLLKEIKDEYGKRLDCFSKSSVNCISVSSGCSLSVNKSKGINSESHRTSLHDKRAKCVVESDCEKISEDESCLRMNELEAELEVELERLQLNLDGEDLYLQQEQQKMELGSDDTILESFSRNFGEVDEAEKEDNDQSCGVSAVELERRLHELLCRRQQERIAELESALECAKRKLTEKEIEVCRWKDTTRLMTYHEEENFWRDDDKRT